MDLQIQNKLALVTGSTAGIGYAIAEALAAEHATVIVNGRTQSGVDDAIAKLTPNVKGDLIGFAGDLTTSEVAAQLVSEHPGVEILVNNLGIFDPVPFEDISDAEWRLFLRQMY